LPGSWQKKVVIALRLEQGMQRETGTATSASERDENMRVWRGNKARNPVFYL
jgi:hypothetical protein